MKQMRWLEGDWSADFEVIGGWLVVIGGDWRWFGVIGIDLQREGHAVRIRNHWESWEYNDLERSKQKTKTRLIWPLYNIKSRKRASDLSVSVSMRSSILELYEAVRFLEFYEALCYLISKDNMYGDDDEGRKIT